MYWGQCLGCFPRGLYDLIRSELKLCCSAILVTGFLSKIALQIFYLKTPNKSAWLRMLWKILNNRNHWGGRKGCFEEFTYLLKELMENKIGFAWLAALIPEYQVRCLAHVCLNGIAHESVTLRCTDKLRFHYRIQRQCRAQFYWWLVGVTLVLGFAFWPQNFGHVVGTYECHLPFCECRWNGSDTPKRWRHLNTSCDN